ncbi:MAG: hypothetical protein ABIS86_14570 [Streptosporangiaceae bacterium]
MTDHVLRVLPPDSAERIRAVLAPLGVRFYVVVESPSLSFEERQRPEELISLLHDRLERDGVYLVTDPSGSGTARQFGGSLPVSDAWLTARVELPYAAGAVEHVERFVEILRSPDVSARIKERRRAPESEYRSRSDARDRAEMTAFVAGTALTGLPLIGVLAWRGRRRNVQKNRGKGGRR